MSIIKTYESRNLPDIHYAMFFFDDLPAECDTVVVVCVMRRLDPDYQWGGHDWSIWHFDISHSEIYDASIDLEVAEPRFDTLGISVECDSFDEVIGELEAFDFDGTDEMIDEVRYFFGAS